MSVAGEPTTPGARPGLGAISRAGVFRRYGGPALLVVAAIALGLAPYWTSDYFMVIGYQMLQLAALALAWNLLAGYAGLVSLASAAFIGIGEYTTAKLTIETAIPLELAMVASGLVAALFALVVSPAMFRFRGLYFTIGTLVLAEALHQFMLNWNGLGGNDGLTLTDFAPSNIKLYEMAFVVAVFATIVLVVIRRLALGPGLFSIRDNEDVAREVGVKTFRTKLWAFTVSSFIMGVVGGLQAAKLGRIEPNGAFTLGWTIDIVNTAIIGGLGTIVGPLLGAGFIVEFRERLGDYPEWSVALTGLLMILVIRFAPRGLWGTITHLVARWSPAEPAVTQSAAPELPARRETAALDGPLLEVEGLKKSFGGVEAVSDVSFRLQAGEVLGIIGPNGAGKSTVIGLLSGAHRPTAGAIRIAGRPAEDLPPDQRARLGIGRTHQVPQPFGGMTVHENLEVACLNGGGAGSRAQARRDADGILALTGLQDFAAMPARDLPLLRLKRLELARALALRPRVLLLDEIAAGLVESEVRELIELIELLREHVEAIIVVEHVLDVVHECCDRVVVIDRGAKLLEGEVATVMADPQVAAVYLGTGETEVREEHERRVRATGEGAPLVALREVSAGYGRVRAVTDVDLRVGEGEAIALLGANGAGKTTLARAISGMIRPTSGEIAFDGRRIDGRPPHQIVAAGIAHCMEGRRIFGNLSVQENLELGGRAGSAADRRGLLEETYELFPVLREKRGQSGRDLSGGQQQMLAIGRALMARPRFVILDEISLGLAPLVVEQLYETLAEINRRGVSMLVIEQNVERGLALADHVYVLEKGRIALDGTPAAVRRDPRLLALYVGEAKGAA